MISDQSGVANLPAKAAEKLVEKVGLDPKAGAGAVEQALHVARKPFTAFREVLEGVPPEFKDIGAIPRMGTSAVEASLSLSEKGLEAIRRLRELPPSQSGRLRQLAAEQGTPTWLKNVAMFLDKTKVGAASEMVSDLTRGVPKAVAHGYATGLLLSDDPQTPGQFAAINFGQTGFVNGIRKVAGRSAAYRRAQGIRGDLAGLYLHLEENGASPEFIKNLEKQFGFDKPAYERFLIMLKNYLTFDFGKSYFRDTTVIQLIKEKLPVSMSLGIWMMLISYLVAIPLGIRKAVQDGSRFDMWTSTIIIIGYALPGFLVAILLIILFAGGSYFDWFPLRGLTSDNWATLSWWQKILDYFWHLVLPISAMMLSAFATLTLLTKNSFLDEIRKQYVLTARAKGCTSRQTLYGHVFRNAMLIVIAGFPSAFVHAFFAGSLLIETIFNLDGLGLLSF